MNIRTIIAAATVSIWASFAAAQAGSSTQPASASAPADDWGLSSPRTAPAGPDIDPQDSPEDTLAKKSQTTRPAAILPATDTSGVWNLPGNDQKFLKEIPELWNKLRFFKPDSKEFDEAKAKLLEEIPKVPINLRVKVASAMMDRYADDMVNMSAIQMFGKDPLPIDGIVEMMANLKRSFNDRVLLRTYYSFGLAEYKDSPISEQMQGELAMALGNQMDAILRAAAEQKVKPDAGLDYGEERLLTHLFQSALSRFASKQDTSPPARRLVEAMENYTAAASENDMLSATMKGWLTLIKWQNIREDSLDGAIATLGHWEALKRIKAAVDLARLGEKDQKVVNRVLSLLDDQRDEVRADAARVFSFMPQYDAKQIVPRMVKMLTTDRGIMVQQAAAEVLSARAEQASEAIAPLLAAVADPKTGQSRRSSMLTVLARLLPMATFQQKEIMFNLAARSLGDMPEGALAVFAALGPSARAILPKLIEYRDKCDSTRRSFIDANVLPAIQKETAGEMKSIGPR